MQVTLKNFFHSFAIQRRVIWALILREIITRYGRNNIGFLWLFVEPLLMTFVVTVFWTAIGAKKASNLPITAFLVTGYSMAMMWRNAANRGINAVSANTSLLYHRNVKPIDVFLSRIILELAGSTIAFINIMLLFFLLGLVKQPANILYMVYAWLLMAWFATGLGLVIGVVSERIEVFGQLWKSISFVMFPLSGAFYLVDALPNVGKSIVLMIPMVHGSEMLRHGYFGDLIKTHESVEFIIVCNLCLTFFGLLFVKLFSRGIEPS